MQTYLPYPDYSDSAEVLDDRRLNKQRTDVLQILKALSEPPPAEGDEHPVIKMWRGNEQHLIKYGFAICMEWSSRGNKDTLARRIMEFTSQFEANTPEPEWMGQEDFHTSHQAHLIRLKPSYYREIFEGVDDDMPVVWPRSPHKQKVSTEVKKAMRLRKRADKAREQAELLEIEALRTALLGGLNPYTFEPLSDEEKTQFEEAFAQVAAEVEG